MAYLTKLEDLVFDTRADAETVLEQAIEVYNKYGQLSVADICDLANVKSMWRDGSYGWTRDHQIDDMTVVRVRDGYAIVATEPFYIAKHVEYNNSSDTPRTADHIELHFNTPEAAAQFLNNYTETTKRPLKIFVD